MLDRETFLSPLLDAYPGFRPQWEEFEAMWSGENTAAPYYILIGDLVQECSTLLRGNREAELARIFSVVERWLLEGDRYVHDIAIVGFLEDLQNTNLHRGTHPSDFERFLGPEGAYWWKKVDRFWSARELIVDDRPGASRDDDTGE